MAFRISLVPLLALALLPAACRSPRTGPEIALLLEQTIESARIHADEGREVEAWQLAQAAAMVDPYAEGLPELRVELEGVEGRIDHPWLGSNHALRKRIDPEWWERVLWYIPDRLLDAVDVVSFDVHLGFGLLVDVHVTESLKLAAGGRGVAGLGWHDHRSLGVQGQTGAVFSLPLVGSETYHAALAGTSGVDVVSTAQGGVHSPSTALYRDYRDFWAVGAKATAVVVGADVDVHLAEVLDLVCGLVLYDPLNDDFAHTERLALSLGDKRRMLALAAVASSEQEMDAYLRELDDQEEWLDDPDPFDLATPDTTGAGAP